MKTKRIRIAVAGLGRIGWNFHCNQIARHRQFELVAVADPEPERRQEAETVRGCRSYEAFEAMIAHEELDAVVVATPTHFHKAHALAAFRKGLHVFLEKPMALTYAEARSIAAAARRAKRVLTVYQPNRAQAWFQHLCRVVRSGRIGTPYHVYGSMCRYVRRNDWQSLTKFGGGMLNNYGAHLLDQALHLTGSRVGKVFCNMRRVAAMGDAEDVVKIVYETPDGLLGEVEINQASAVPGNEFEVLGTHGAVVKRSLEELHVTWYNPRDLRKRRLDTHLASADRKYPRDRIPFKEKTIAVNPRYEVDVYKNLARAIRTGAAPMARPEETLAVMKVMESCRADARRIRETPI